MNNKYSLFKNNNVKNNNKMYCKIDNNDYVFKKKEYKEIKNILDKLFKSSKYVFNIPVIIKTNNNIYDTKIIGKRKNSIITENMIEIPIIEICDLIIK